MAEVYEPAILPKLKLTNLRSMEHKAEYREYFIPESSYYEG